MKSRATNWIPAVLYAALITYMSSRPAGGIPRWEFLKHDKIIHATEYTGFGLLLARALPPVAAIATGTVFGVVDEFHQSFVPGRQGNDPGDMAADFVGSTLGAGAYWLVATRKKRRAEA